MIVTSPIDEVRSWSRAQAVAVSKGWWVLLLTGLVSILAGAIIVFTRWNVDDLVVFVGALLIIRGAMTMFSIPVDGSLRTWSVVLGVVEVFVGIGVFVWPGPGLLVVALSIGWLLFFRGTMAVIGSVTARKTVPYWGVVLATGILEVLVAVYLLGQPGLTLLAAVFAIGFASVLYGVLEIVTAFEVRSLPQRLDELAGKTQGTDSHRSLDPVG